MSTRKISVTGLGYVGLPLLISFSKHRSVIGFDVSDKRIEQLKNKNDINNEHEVSELSSKNLFFTSNPKDLLGADFHIITVPTPVSDKNIPDLSHLKSASETIGSILKKGDIVVYESTVFPGATEEECIPVLESTSLLRCGVDFDVGYSPERINPGDKIHTIDKIVKVVSANSSSALKIISQTYKSIIDAGIFEAQSIKVAEAAKVIENTQRDINIALVNELSKIFNLMDIDTLDVLAAARTKWNFLDFRPGLVGGHCIGVDPYYLTYKSREFGYEPEVILSGRKVNDEMASYISNQIIKKFKNSSLPRSISILGVTFKENCADIRNSKILDIINELHENGFTIQVCDPNANAAILKNQFKA
jgi:UDP-N-acetyl-D-galactosamine dehydrogenase